MSARKTKPKTKSASELVPKHEAMHKKFVSPDGYPMVATRLANGLVPFYQVAQLREDLIRQGLVPCPLERRRTPIKLIK